MSEKLISWNGEPINREQIESDLHFAGVDKRLIDGERGAILESLLFHAQYGNKLRERIAALEKENQTLLACFPLDVDESQMRIAALEAENRALRQMLEEKSKESGE